ncbi:hypothetical protein [Pseudoalteromonas sp. G4]|uniref:hypothetical protein n=1 Tax=Pseudoalteromonas sp. G4 TaxID=2992761 RepID=UPI0031587D78
MQQHFGQFNFRLNKQCTLVVSLEHKSQVNEVLARLPKLGQVIHISSRNMDLHQMYLKAIESHQSSALSKENNHE